MSSRPTTPPAKAPRPSNDFRFVTNGTACEWGEAYHPGGYHPVHLGDLLNNRFHVIRKVGYGEYSSVWLTVDTQSNTYVVVKISIASRSAVAIKHEVEIYSSLENRSANHIVGLLDTFHIDGPNGRHACLLYEPMGPSLPRLLLQCPDFQFGEVWDRRFTKDFAKQALRDILVGLDYLQTRRLPKEKLRHDSKEQKPLRRLDGKKDLWAPEYILEPSSLYDYVSFDLRPIVKITGLGSAFQESHPPKKTVTPVALQAPEAILSLTPGRGVDIWCFGCLIFELLTGRQLFVGIDLGITDVIGPLPESLSLHWRRRDEYFDEHGERLDILAGDGSEEDGGGGLTERDGDDIGVTSLAGSDTSDQAQVAELACPGQFDPFEQQFRQNRPPDMDDEEEGEVVELLKWIF